MKVPYYAIKDELVGFIPESVRRGKNDDFEKRAFADACTDKDTDLHRFPLHFSLWFIGWFDQATGEFDNNVKLLARASDYVPKDGD